MITDYFKPGPRPSPSPVPRPVVKQPVQKRPVGRPRKRPAVPPEAAVDLEPEVRIGCDEPAEITPNYNATP